MWIGLFSVMLAGTLMCAYGRRWWLVALGLVICFAVRIVAPPPPLDELDSGKGIAPRRLIIIQQEQPPLPPIVIRPYRDSASDQ